MWVQETMYSMGVYSLHDRALVRGGGHMPAYCNVPMHECITHCCLPPWANVPAHSTWWKNVFASVRGVKMAM